ncbi:MAG: DUF881 domain-containing protein [Actinomycetota bacterium]
MEEMSSDRPAPSRRGASIAFLAGLVLLGFLAVSAARQAHPGPRLAGKSRLVDLIRSQDDRTAELRRDLEQLQRQLAAMETGTGGAEQRLAALRAQAEALDPYVGLAPVAGPGLRVELRDSTLQESPTGDPNDLVIHEQDLQAVVNALWAGGAESIAVNGERVTALSAIRCVGNTLLLHGTVYSPPYVIAAVGDAPSLLSAMERDEGVERLRIVAERFKLGFSADRAGRIALPAFRGLTVLRYATILPASSTGAPR